jgi:hypothetical protein
MTGPETSTQQAGVPGGALLAAMDPDDFEALLRSLLGPGAPPAAWDALTSPEVIERTRVLLTGWRVDVQSQLAVANTDLRQAQAEGMKRGDEGKRDYLDARSGQDEWRRRALNFQRLVEKRMALVKARTPHPQAQKHTPYGPGGTKPARKHNRQALEDLARAVALHQSRVISGEGGEDDDDNLWDCLRSITAVNAGGEALPLIDWLDYFDEVREDDE